MGILELFADKTEDLAVVCDLQLEKYLGTWYEVARLPNSFEEGLDNVTATYELEEDGKIKVINSGYRNGVKKAAIGTAWLPDQNCTGKLLVSFFWIFKSEYKVIDLDQENYQYAMVTSSTKSYLWILSRQPQLDDQIYNQLIAKAESQGFNVQKLIKVEQNIWAGV